MYIFVVSVCKIIIKLRLKVKRFHWKYLSQNAQQNIHSLMKKYWTHLKKKEKIKDIIDTSILYLLVTLTILNIDV